MKYTYEQLLETEKSFYRKAGETVPVNLEDWLQDMIERYRRPGRSRGAMIAYMAELEYQTELRLARDKGAQTELRLGAPTAEDAQRETDAREWHQEVRGLPSGKPEYAGRLLNGGIKKGTPRPPKQMSLF